MKDFRAVINTVILTTENKEEENKRKVASKGIQVLLVRNGENWSLPMVLVKGRESLLGLVNKDLEDRLRLTEVYTEQLATYDMNIDEKSRVIGITYLSLVTKSKVNLGSEDTKWFWVEEKEKEIYFIDEEKKERVVLDLSFGHKRMVKDSIERLRNKIMYTNVGFNLVNEYFTIAELQAVYEVILCTSICGFRKLIMPKLEKTDILVDGKAHRPARLYKIKLE